MLQRFNENELLEFVEDQLAPADGLHLRHRLGEHPEILAHLEEMRRDRTILSTEAEPMLAIDIVARLEPLLAKPMLLGESPARQIRPGVYRARHRQSFARRWGSLAMAASLLLVAGAGIYWSATEFLPSLGEDAESLLTAGESAEATTTNDEAGDEATRFIAENDASADGADPSTTHLAATNEEDVRPEPTIPMTYIALRDGTQAIDSPLTLVLAGDEGANILERLRTGLLAGDLDGSLVRNFTYAQAEQAWRDMVRSSGLPQQEQLIASMDGLNAQSMTLQQKETIERVARSATIQLGEYLAGNPAHAAAADQQLRLGESGASHSLTIRASEIAVLVESLAREFEGALELQTVAGTDESTTESDSSLETWRRWRETSELLRAIERAADGTDLLIVLPLQTPENS